MQSKLIVILLFISINARSQSTSCSNYLNIQVKIFLNNYNYDSLVDNKEQKPQQGIICGIRQFPILYELKAEVPGFIVESFFVSFQDSNGDVIEVPNDGREFNTVVMRHLLNVKSNTTLYIDCIKARNKEGIAYYLKPFQYAYVKP